MNEPTQPPRDIDFRRLGSLHSLPRKVLLIDGICVADISPRTCGQRGKPSFRLG
jgi:hypothetical protein